MKNLTKKDQAFLSNILIDLKKAQKYILRVDTLICLKDTGKPYGTSYVNKEGAGLSVMNKEIGSDICYLYNSIRNLENALYPPVTVLETENLF